MCTVYIHIDTHICIFVSVYIYMHINMYTCLHIYIYIYIYLCTYVRINFKYTRTSEHAQLCIHVHTHIFVCASVCLAVNNPYICIIVYDTQSIRRYVYTNPTMHTCIYIYKMDHPFTYINIAIQQRIHVCKYI